MGGKKPSKRKASTKQTTSAVRKIIDSADDVERIKRAKTVAGAVKSSSSLVGQPSAPTTVTVSVTNTGNTINFTAPSPQPPPLIQTLPVRSTQSSPSSYYVGQPFRLMFLNTRISRCQGCRGQILQGYSCPRDLVFQHKEHVLFLNPNTGNWQLSHDLCNTYYHATFQCVSAKHTNFDASEILLSQDVIDQLSLSHKSFLNSEFGLAL